MLAKSSHTKEAPFLFQHSTALWTLCFDTGYGFTSLRRSPLCYAAMADQRQTVYLYNIYLQLKCRGVEPRTSLCCPVCDSEGELTCLGVLLCCDSEKNVSIQATICYHPFFCPVYMSFLVLYSHISTMTSSCLR